MRPTDNTCPDDSEELFTAYITLKDGRRIYAASKGLKAFRIRVKRPKR